MKKTRNFSYPSFYNSYNYCQSFISARETKHYKSLVVWQLEK